MQVQYFMDTRWTFKIKKKQIGLTVMVYVVKLDKEKVCVQIRASQ